MGASREPLAVLSVLVVAVFLIWFLIFKKNSPRNTISPQSGLSFAPNSQNPDAAAVIRDPAVSGSFYPGDPISLRAVMRIDLAGAKKTVTQKPRILIVPHAGIEYAGYVAAAGFDQLQGFKYSKIILLGPSHNYAFTEAAVFPDGVWRTPLGDIPVNAALAAYLINPAIGIRSDASVHLNEHSLEMELIFLQSVMKDFTIVPILVSQPSETLRDQLAAAIADNFDDDTLLVVSTDLSHYPDRQTANIVDHQTLAAILTGEVGKFTQVIDKQADKNYSNLATSACGQEAIKIALLVAAKLNITDFQLVKYANSGDIPGGDPARVVGYGAVVGVKDQLESPKIILSRPAEKEAVTIARQALADYLNGKKFRSEKPKNPDLLKPLGVFVTLTQNGQLRGCIGEFEPADPLYRVIQRTIVKSAAQDPRFDPLPKSDLDRVHIELSVMTPPKQISSWRMIRYGRDGVVIQNGRHAGTFLPQVAAENHWDETAFLEQLCLQKAGLPADCYKDPQSVISVFQTQVFEE